MQQTNPNTKQAYTGLYDAREGQAAQAREAALMAALPLQIAHAQKHSPAYAEILQGVDAKSIQTREALAQLPIIRKSTLLHRQRQGHSVQLQVQKASTNDRSSEAVAADSASYDAFGGFATIGWNGLVAAQGARRVYQSPGPIYEPEGQAPDYWRLARALHAAGFCAGDLVHIGFSYHLTPGGWMMENAAQALGCTTFAAGVGNTDLQLQAMHDLRPVAYAGTPSFLRILLEKAQEQGQALSLRKALVSGEALPPSLQEWFAERGIATYQCYASADLGLIAFETSAKEGLVLAEDLILEIVRPGTGQAVPDGEVGEVVITSLNPDYPLIRFATGDLSATLAGACSTGRSNTRIRGWLGRADQTTKVRGMFVHPEQVAQAIAPFSEVLKARLVVSGSMGQDQMHLQVESPTPSPELAQGLTQSLRDATQLRGELVFVEVGSLANDGKVIEDARTYE